jgi:tRNA(His) 5'-end guanylyltransferase
VQAQEEGLHGQVEAVSTQDSLGDRVKRYERATEHYLTPNMPVIIRVDGKAFHTWTKGMGKPFDGALIAAMQLATRSTAKEMSGFKLAYTQSDEATFLITDTDTHQTQGWFGYSLNKIVSVTASLFAGFFNDELRNLTFTPAAFDARAFSVPADDVPNVFVWRQQDWARNSISMFARSHFTHSQLQGQPLSIVHEMLYDKGLNWAHCSEEEKNGTFVDRGGNFISELRSYYGIKALIDDAFAGE